MQTNIELIKLSMKYFDQMYRNGLKPIRVEFDDFDKKDPMKKVADTISSCNATIVLGLERSHAYFLKNREGSKKETEENHVIYTSGWIHIESGMAISLGQEVFMLAEKNIVSDGIFDRDWNSFPIIEIDSLEDYEIQIEKLIAIVKSRFI